MYVCQSLGRSTVDPSYWVMSVKRRAAPDSSKLSVVLSFFFLNESSVLPFCHDKLVINVGELICVTV